MIDDAMSFDEALDVALDALNSGTRLDIALALIPEHAAAARPLLQTVAQARREAPVSLSLIELSPTLAAGWRNVQIELDAARGPDRVAPVRARPAWLKRRVASLSLPVFVILGISGAAAAAAAAGAGGALPENVSNIVPFAHESGGGEPPRGAYPPASGIDPGGASAAQGSETSSDAPSPGSENAPVLRVLDGDASDINGNTFTVTSIDGEWKVNIDGQTEVSGELSEGAVVTVEGDVTAEKNMHARKLHVTKPGSGSDEQHDRSRENPDDIPGDDGQSSDGASGDPDDDHPAVGPDGGGAPGQEKTPPAESSGGDAPPGDDAPPGNSEGAPGQNKDDD